MIGCYDFCGHYEWTFGWLEREGGAALLHEYWDACIYRDAQVHARELVSKGGFDGMAEYWGHTLAEESPDAGYIISRGADWYRIDMHDCPSKGFLIRNQIRNFRDYCDHCIGWIGPLMKENGFVVDHEHNHCGQCWWVMRRAGTDAAQIDAASAEKAGRADVRARPEWTRADTVIDSYSSATGPGDKR